jgi:hypothetical protein
MAQELNRQMTLSGAEYLPSTYQQQPWEIKEHGSESLEGYRNVQLWRVALDSC